MELELKQARGLEREQVPELEPEKATKKVQEPLPLVMAQTLVRVPKTTEMALEQISMAVAL